MAKSRSESRKHSLLSEVTKRGQDAIARIMAERDGNLPLDDFLAKRWNFENHLRSQGRSKRDVDRAVMDCCAQMRQQHPEWSEEQIRAAISLSYLSIGLKEAVIARRFTLNDPAELGRGLSVLSRLRWLDCLIGGYSYVDFDFVTDAFAARDLAAVENLARGEAAVSEGSPEFLELCSVAVEAAYRRDSAKIRSVARRMTNEKLAPWQNGICLCFMGICDAKPDRISEGLGLLLDGMPMIKFIEADVESSSKGGAWTDARAE